VKSGLVKFDDARERFMAQLDNGMVPGAPAPGFINRAQFLDFYEDLNGSFATDSVGDDFFNFSVYIPYSDNDDEGERVKP
jgi:hypothetical protein